MNHKLQQILYYSVIVFFFTSSILAFSYFVGEQKIWSLFSKAYLLLILLNTWYVFLMLYFRDIRKDDKATYKGERVTVVMPTYNEEYEHLDKAIQSILRAKGNKELLLVDDGSDPKYKQYVHDLQKNKGKRSALYCAIKYVVNTPYLITVDGDTVLDENAIVNVVASLKGKNIGAVSGDVALLNEKSNMLTRMIGAYYWVALRVGRKSESTLGNVSCCSGCIAGYKTAIVKPIIDEYVSQTFLNARCTYGEDRHLTNLVLRQGYKVIFDESAIAYTSTPDTLVKFMKQQIRWKRGFARESIYSMTFAWKVRKLLFMNTFRDIIFIYSTYSLKIISVVLLFTDPLFFLQVVIPSWVIFLFVRDILLFIHAPKKIPGLLLYVILNEFLFSWQYIYALFTVRNTSWSTRGSEII